MPLKLDFICDKCGGEMNDKIKVEVVDGETVISIEPCASCLRNERNEGYNDGINA